MALTLRQTVDAWMPTYNPIEFVLDSSNIAQPKFKYIADVYVSGSANYVRLVCDADPSYSQGYFNVARILESYLGTLGSSVDNFDILRTGNGFKLALNSWVAYEVKFGEQYEVAGVVVNFTDLVVTGTKYTHNAVYSPREWLSYNGAATDIENSGGWLTTAPTTQTYAFSTGNQDRYLHFITSVSGSAYFAEVKTYNSAGGLIQTALIQNTYQNVSSYTYRRQYFMAGARALNLATLYSGTQPLIDTGVASYTVRLRTFAGSYYTPLQTYQNDDKCYNERTPINIHWLNVRGGFDSMEFTMVNKYKSVKTTDTHRRKLGVMGGNSYGYTASDAGKVVHDTRIQSRFELTSDWIDTDNSEMIMNMIASPVVFMELGTSLIRGTITSPTESELMAAQYGNTDLSNIKVVFELSQEEWRQRG